MLEVCGLGLKKQDQWILRDVNFEVFPGQICALVGVNGAGKTSLLELCAGLFLASEGSIRFDGQDLAKRQGSVSFLPDFVPVYGYLNVEQHLEFTAQLFGKNKAILPQLIHRFALGHVLKSQIGQISYGYRRRLGLCLALIQDPKIILLDEPLNGLDPVQVQEFCQTLQWLRKDKIVLISSHQLHEVSSLCDRTFVLKNGKIYEYNQNHLCVDFVFELEKLLFTHVEQALMHHGYKFKVLKIDKGIKIRVTMVQDERHILAKILVDLGVHLQSINQVNSLNDHLEHMV